MEELRFISDRRAFAPETISTMPTHRWLQFLFAWNVRLSFLDWPPSMGKLVLETLVDMQISLLSRDYARIFGPIQLKCRNDSAHQEDYFGNPTGQAPTARINDN